MNLKTTFVLAVLVVVGAIAWVLVAVLQLGGASNETLNVLEHELTPQALTRIEVRRGEHHVTLEKSGAEWSLPGKWPVRNPEVGQLVETLTTLRSRFRPIPLTGDTGLNEFGLEGKALVVLVRAGGKDYTLTFGEKHDSNNHFSSPTFVRLGERREVVRLAPGLVAALDQPEDFYMRRQLFPAERVATEGEKSDKIDRLTARSIAVKAGPIAYTLAYDKAAWELREPLHDQADPEKLKTILAAVPDIWAERFVDGQDQSLDAFGLKDPKERLSITRTNGDTITLLVGKESPSTKERMVMKPGLPTGGPIPPQPRMEMVREEYRFAKLQDNDRVFEIKANRLKDLAVAADQLRDARLARFKPEEVTRVVIDEGGRQLVLAKEKESWRLEKPLAVAAESAKVTELLDKLSGLQASEKDIIDKAEPKQYGLDKPATVKLTVVPSAKAGSDATIEEAKKGTPREIAFKLGSSTADTKQVYVQVVGWPRVNAVNVDVLKLIRQPALAFRNRRVLDFAGADLHRIEVRPSKGEPFTLEQDKGKWRLSAPVSADIESFKADQLAGDLGRLEATEFVTAEPKKEDLEKVYGLEKPALTVTAVFADAKKTPETKKSPQPDKPPQTLFVGKQRGSKEEYYARLASDPAIFIINKETRATIDKESLAYRALELWEIPPENVAEVRVQKNGPEFRLDRAGTAWKIAAPFTATAAPAMVGDMVKELAVLKADRFTAHRAKDLGEYGLDKPYLRVSLKSTPKDAAAKTDKLDLQKEKEHVLLVGKPVDKEGKGRYARLADGEAIFVVADKFVAAADHDALDLLEHKLLGLGRATISRIETTGDAKFNLVKENKLWRVTGTPAAPFAADSDAVEDVLRVWSNLRASKFAAYGDKVDLAKFGLDKAATGVTVIEQPAEEKGKPGKAIEHTLQLGKQVEGGHDARYARLDKGPGVVVLDANTLKIVNRTYLDYVNHTVFEFSPEKVSGLQRSVGPDALEVVRRADKWQLVKPSDLPADLPTVNALCQELSSLRAVKIAAYPAKDLLGFGLDKPAAVVTIRMADKSKPAEHVLQLGKLADKESGACYARADGSDAVIVVPGKLAKDLLAGALQFRDRNLASMTAPDKVVIQRGSRKATFTLADGTWKMTEPVAAEAESSDLQAFLESLTTLRAEQLIADKPGDVKPYGLNPPQAVWHFLQGDKETLSLVVGKSEKTKDGKDRAYAQLGKGSLVFLLDSQATTRALGEYRVRKVWGTSAPDAAQVEMLKIDDHKKTFVLHKIDNKWQVTGKPMAQVNEDAVRETLDALSRLEAERYVADKSDGLKLYGLEPPELVLELTTPTGKRVLHIGHKEDVSQQYYATVPGPASAVFLLSAADARRLVRPLEAFLSKTR